jgi:hypothetical protein
MSNAENRACLQDLQATDPATTRTASSRIRVASSETRTTGSSKKNSDFQQWRNDQQSRLPWIKGDPGKGKTMLLCGIINELIKPTSHTTNVSFFFCRRSRAIAVGSARSPSHMTRHGSHRRVKIWDASSGGVPADARYWQGTLKHIIRYHQLVSSH